MTSIELKRLARRIAKIEREQANQGKPQLAYSSIENGNLKSYEGDDLKMIVGLQDDGGQATTVFNGPTPPTPVGFTVDVDHGKFIVHWSGDFDGNALAPSDWSRAEVHASQDPFFVPSRATARGSIVSAAGGEVTIGVLKGPWSIKMLAWSQAGKMSAPSTPVDVEVPGYGEIVLEEIDAAQTRIENAREVLVTEQGTLGEKLDATDGTLTTLGQDIAAVEAAQDALSGDLSEVMTSIDGKNTITWNPSAPSKVSNPGKAVGDLWYRTSGNSIVGFWKWDGTDWVTQLLDVTTIPLIDIGAGTFGSLSGARLDVGSVTADKMLIGGSENMIPMSGVDAGAGVNPHSAYGGRTIELLSNLNPGREYTNAIWMRGQEDGTLGTWDDAISFNSGGLSGPIHGGQAFPVKVGQSFRFDSFLIRRGSEPDGRVMACMSIVWYDFAGNAISRVSGPENGGVYTTDNQIYVEGTAPNAAAYLRLFIRTDRRGDIVVWRTRLLEQKGTVFIEAGGITTPKLAADVLEVKNLKATSGQLNEAVINKLFSDVVVAKMAVAQEFIGENAILTGAVTAPKITASEELWAKLGQFVKIRAEHIQSDAFDFMVARGGTYLTSGGNGSWSDNGLFISGPDGTSLVRFPTDGSPLSLSASDTQIDRASISELDVTNGEVRSGGTMTLAAGVTAPASPPELSAAWNREAQLPRPAESSMDWTGLAVWNGLYVRGVNVLGSEGDPHDRIEVYNPDGTLNKSISIDLNPRAGVAVIGDIVYTIGPDHVERSGAEKQWCHGFDLNTGARVSRWEYVHFFSPGQKKIAIGNDVANLIVAGVGGSAATLYLFTYTPSTGAQVGSTLTTAFDTGSAADIHGVATSGGKVYVSPRQTVREYTISGSSLVKSPNFAWDNPNKNSGGFTFVDGVPVVVDSGAVYTGSKFTSDATVQACFTWTNGSQETTPSPIAVGTVSAREHVTISLPRREGLQKNLYMKSSLNGGSWTKTTIPEATTSILVDLILAGLYGLPTQNTFPASTPAVLKSGVGNLEFRGDGSGRIGPLTFNADGTMTGIPKMAHGTVVLTPPADNTTVTAAVTFPEGRFSTPPTVVVSSDTTVPGTNVLGVSSTNISTTSFDAVLRRTNAVPSRMYWIAMGE